MAGAAAFLLIFWGIHSFFQTRNLTLLSVTEKKIFSVKSVPDKVERITETEKTEKVEKQIAMIKKESLKFNQPVNQPVKTNLNIKTDSLSSKRDSMAPEELKPVETLLEAAATQHKLAVSFSINSERPENRKSIATASNVFKNR